MASVGREVLRQRRRGGVLDLAGLDELRDDALDGVRRDREADADVALRPVPPVSICALTPITSPRALISGPPELPWLMAASVWMTWSIAYSFGAVIWRWSALTMPAVTVRRGRTGCRWRRPRRRPGRASESPSVSGVSARAGASTWRTARSVEGSEPTTSRLMLVVVRELTLIGLRALDDVVVRDDVAGLVDDEARAERLLGLRRRAEGVANGSAGVTTALVAVICTTPGATSR